MTLELWCHKCRRLQPHGNIEKGMRYGELGRLVHGVCLVCGHRFKGGYVTYESRDQAAENADRSHETWPV